ncbi:MAG TPA: transketolase, partial [Microthrixaceae bacterium]|nr:transketolase [Microthrixaceae bacterium]HNJ24753.1 transketolase [Microthrixaceae bacterium]HNJ70716.1 transketolase [Microthrixaceae bacterium]HNK39230.1 transketolase [Microthrixaceae bacterium]HNL50259.1 transketolase [Microthrixaceae bacterium]
MSQLPSPMDPALEQRAINVIRGLAMDAPAAARSGHQGTAMALAPLAHVLWTRIMRYDASAPQWADRDRFILSCGHASILQYAMLHLTGYDVSIEDLESFRQWGSRTPGHPEVGHTPGIEVTTGPLGQGFANGVGMAIAEASLRERFGVDVCDHHIWAMVSDGDLSEGVSHEAASLAGHLGLGRLVYVYDDNHISIDGPTELALSDNAATRFDSYGWHVIELGEAAEDLDAMEQALLEARSVEDRPSLVIVRSHIAFPSPRLTDDASAHGLAFGAEDITETKSVMGLPDEPFFVPDDVRDLYRAAGARGRVAREDWEQRSRAALAGREADWEASIGSRGLPGWADVLPAYTEADSPATRVASGDCVAALAGVVPGLVAGAADLIGNTGTKLPGAGVLSAAEPGGRQIHFGIREHAMGSIMVGAAHHGGVLPAAGTFLVFSDYMRPAARLAALSGAKCVFVWTHDSVGVGEDGPTHQPVEHVMSLRLIPDLTVIRPADGNETAAAWRVAVDGDGPVALILSRQNTPVLPTTATRAVDGVSRGGYVIADADAPDVVLVGTGTEVAVALEAAGLLAEDGRKVQVVSLPCWDRFDAQDEDYRRSVLPPGVPTVSVEAGVTLGWDRYADASVGIDRFGASAPGGVVLRELGIT